MTQTNKRRAYLYQRYSSATQDGNSSLFRQTESQQAWLARHPEVETEGPNMYRFVDQGVSGFSGKNVNRGSLGNLLREIEAGLIEPGSLILIEHFSRLTRQNITEAEAILKKIWKHGVTLVTTRDGSEYPPEAANNMLQRIRLLVEIESAYSDSKWRSEKAKSSHAKKRADAADGKTPRMRKPFWLDTEGKLNDHAEAVKDMFNLYLGGDGQVTIVKKLSEKYPKSQPILRMSPPTVIRCLKNEIAIGVWRGNKVYQPVVSDDVFYQVQHIHQNKLFKNVKPDRLWFLSGLIECGSCGKGTSIQQTQDSMPVIRCSNRQRIGPKRSGCKNPTTFPYALVDNFFENHLLQVLLNRMTANEMTEKNQKEYNKLKIELSNSQAKFDMLNDKFLNAKADSSLSTLIDLMQFTQNEIDSLRKKIEIIESTQVRVSPYEVSMRVRELSHNKKLLNHALHQIGFRIIWHDKTISYEGSKLEYLGYSRKDKRYKYLLNGSASMYPADFAMIDSMLMAPAEHTPETLAQRDAFNKIYEQAVEQHKNTGEFTMSDVGQLLRTLKK